MGEEEGYIDGLRCIEGSIESAEAEALEVYVAARRCRMREV